MAVRKGGDEEGAMGGSAKGMTQAIVMMAVTTMITLIMVGLVASQMDTLLTDNTITWSNFPGAESMLGLFPLMMLLSILIMGILLSYLTYTGRTKMTSIGAVIASSIGAVIISVFMPTIVDLSDTLRGYTFPGFSSIASMVPMFVVLGAMGAIGLLGFGVSKKM
ncbi:MAG: hypothetical protein PHV74_06740 [Dehalococcoidia bacterium]|nr:hypothetical protein [Dehalococcoidia bacterium]